MQLIANFVKLQIIKEGRVFALKEKEKEAEATFSLDAVGR